MSYPELINNKFIVEQPASFGVFANYATGYRIEENTFEDPDPNSEKSTVGLLISNSGSAENEVYKNEYKTLNVAQQFLYKNSRITTSGTGTQQPLDDLMPNFKSHPPITGLQTLCNDFYYSQSVDILVGNCPKYYENSIRERQGSMQKPAGNEFRGNTPLNIDNTLSQHTINYYYDIHAANAVPSKQNVSLISTSSSNGCPSKLGKVIEETGQEQTPELALAQYNDWDSKYESWLDQFLASGGKDQQALDMVSYYSALKDNLFNSIIVNTFGGYDEKEDPHTIIENLRDLFYYRGNYMDYLSIMETFLAENDYNQALAILAKMYNQFAVTKEHDMELGGLETYVQWLQQLEKKGINIYELSQQELDFLIGYVQSNIGRGVVFANIILCKLYEICMEQEGAANCGGGSGGEMITGVEDPRESVSSASSAFQKSALENITLYPNPTTGELTIKNYELKITSIEIFDVYGRNVGATLAVAQGKINISHLNPGIYFVKITTDAGAVVKKVVKH